MSSKDMPLATPQTASHPALPALKPCPFCGAAPRMIDDDSYGHCQAGVGVPVNDRQSEAEAIAAWNRRSSNSHAALVEALTAMVNRWEPDTAGADRRMWEDARAALALATKET